MKLKKIMRFLKVLLTVFLIIILVVILVQRISKNNMAVGGIRIFSIITGSMEPVYQIGDILISKKVDPSTIQINDRITYKGTAQELRGLIITHEVINKREENGKYYFITKGIASDFEDPEISEDNIYGKVIYKTVVFSFFGQLMSNMIIYYIFFVIVGIYFSYQIISGLIPNKKEENENE